MSALALDYAPAPAGIPADLTRPSSRYRLQVVVVLVCLLLFLLLYVALVIGSAYLLYWAVIYPLGNRPGRGEIFLKLVSISSAGLLFVFLLKGLFKWQSSDPGARLEITEQEQPRLFAFIRQLCAETGAPFPKRVFLSPDVNAAVFYNSSVLSLFLPTRKNLLIGLGLVNVLNLSEFKAVLAHEFGHFSQSSMKLGGYVYLCNRIIADIVYGRDWVDDMLAQLKHTDVRVAVFVWVFYGILWVLKQVLAGCFQVINFSNSALSRQMEFNADLVAVKVSGSDALVHALSRLDFANDALIQASHDLRTAGDHKLWTSDLFHHQTQTLHFLRKVRNEPQLGQPPVLPDDPMQTVQVFQPGDSGIPLMWATHPSNHDREQNAKRLYVRSPLDERSPWLLFEKADEVRRKMTELHYRSNLGMVPGPELASPEQVQAFIDDEHAEMTYDQRYHALYDGRFLEPGALPDLVAACRAEPWNDARLAGANHELYGSGLKDWMEKHHQKLGEFQLLNGLVQGELSVKGKDFEFRGKRVRPTEVKPLLEQVDGELTQDREWLAKLDREVFLAHYQMAGRLGEAVRNELMRRYEFHLAVQEALRQVNGQRAQLDAALQYLQQNHELSQEQFREVMQVFRDLHDGLRQVLQTARGLQLPGLKNMTAGQVLADFLLDRPLISAPNLQQNTIEGQWIGGFLEQLAEIGERLKRIHFKSLGQLLALQEKIHLDWQQAHAPAVQPA
ncbi:MAG: M48 family metalloprotease [Planctomycetia bacterium]|nr:M48 family metalloprotease [Planctomycetia bacterium]